MNCVRTSSHKKTKLLEIIFKLNLFIQKKMEISILFFLTILLLYYQLG